MRIEFVSLVEEVNPENDNIDVLLHLDDGRTFSFVVATPNNIYWCMDNEGLDHFISHPPPVFVKRITPESVEQALSAILESGQKQLNTYGALQDRPNPRNEVVEPTLYFTYDFDERAACEVEQKGWASGLVRLPDGRRAAVNFYDPIVLAQEVERSGCCFGEPGLIVVPGVTLENMQSAVKQLHQEGYFNTLADLLPASCPCCGYLTLGIYAMNPGGHCEICPVCGWVRNQPQSLDPELAGGPNEVSLKQAQANYREFGASQRIFSGTVRQPRSDEFPSGHQQEGNAE